MNTTAITGNRRLGRRRTSRNLELFAAIGMGDDMQPSHEWLMFDRACPFCTRAAKRIEPIVGRRGVGVIPLQTDWVQEYLRDRNEPLLKEIRFLATGGKLTGGADALIEAASRFWWVRPIAIVARIPIVLRLLRKAYDRIAAKRHCSGVSSHSPRDHYLFAAKAMSMGRGFKK